MIGIKPNAPFFSVITVCLDAGDALPKTARNVFEQSYLDFEYIIKDGGTKDGSVTALPSDPKIRFCVAADKSIYDAMNQAIRIARGRYLVFMNAGDCFASSDVLERVAACASANDFPGLVYTYYFNSKTGVRVVYPARLSRKFLYRRGLCHQATYIRRDLFDEDHLYRASDFLIFADHDFVVDAIINRKVSGALCPIVGTRNEGYGMSAEPRMRQVRDREMRIIKRRYFTFRERLICNAAYALTIPCLRMWIINRPTKSPLKRLYHRVAGEVNKRDLM